MTTIAYKAVEQLVIDALGEITVDNGYFSNITILNGWLTFYAHDLIHGLDGKTFPAVSVHYDKDSFVNQSGQSATKTTRSIKLTGAVSTTNPSDVNRLLDELLHDVCCAIGTNRKLTIVESDYMLPNGNDPYAMFDMTVSLVVNDIWEKQK